MSDQKLTHINFCAINRFSSSYNALNTMRRKNEFCDVQFVVGGIKISAHKAILSSHSNYFNDMFIGNFKDSKLLDIKNVEITPSSFELLIDFLYTSQITINDYNVQELLIASHFLMLNDVEEECLKYLEQNIDIGNFMTIKRIADMNEVKDLHELFLSYVLKNYNNVVKSNTFLSFSFELMMELIQSDDLHAEEEEAYESIMMWLKHDLKERLKCLPELFKSIRLSLMSIDYLDDIVQEEELIRSDITSMNYLCSAYKVVHQQEKSLVNVLTSTLNVTRRKFSKKSQSYSEKEKSNENDAEESDEDIIEEQEKSVEIDDEECEDTEDDGNDKLNWDKAKDELEKLKLRAAETPSMKNTRILQQRENRIQQRDAETPTHKEDRKTAEHERYLQRAAAETPESREARKQAEHKRYLQRAAAETTESREARKQAEHERYLQRSAAETTESNIDALEEMERMRKMN